QLNGAKSQPNGGNQPPRNSIVVSAQIMNMLAYSPSMNSAKVIAEYSVLKPPTSSDSPSGRSKGGRLVSARPEMKNTTSIGDSSSHCHPVCLASTTAVRLSEPTVNSTETMTKPIETSYDTICAAERSPPRKEYF